MKKSAGAEERTRTSTGLLPLAPEASASTNFATSASSCVGLDLSGQKVVHSTKH